MNSLGSATPEPGAAPPGGVIFALKPLGFRRFAAPGLGSGGFGAGVGGAKGDLGAGAGWDMPPALIREGNCRGA